MTAFEARLLQRLGEVGRPVRDLPFSSHLLGTGRPTPGEGDDLDTWNVLHGLEVPDAESALPGERDLHCLLSSGEIGLIMKQWPIAEGTRADAADMVALDERNFARGDRFSQRLWRTILDQAASGKMLTLVARDQGAVVGAIVGEFHPRAGRLVVWSIAVDELHRGSGLAQQLMAELIQRTPPTFAVVRLDARRDNARARRFYERLGFRQEGEVRRAYADGTDAIRYSIRLDELRDALRHVGGP